MFFSSRRRNCRRDLPRVLLHRGAQERLRVGGQSRRRRRRRADFPEKRLPLLLRRRRDGRSDPRGDLPGRSPQPRFGHGAQPLEEVEIEGELEDPLVEAGVGEHVGEEQHRRARDLAAQLEGRNIVHVLRDPGPLLPDRHLLVLLLGEEGGLVPLAALLLLLELGDRIRGVRGDEVGGERAQLLLGHVLAVPGEHPAAGLLVEAVAEDPHREPQLRLHETIEVSEDVVPPVFEAPAHQVDVLTSCGGTVRQAEEPADGGDDGVPRPFGNSQVAEIIEPVKGNSPSSSSPPHEPPLTACGREDGGAPSAPATSPKIASPSFVLGA